jgi:AraC family transcriptional regulator
MNQVALSDTGLQIISGRASDIVRRIYEELLHIDTASGIAFEGLALVLLAETIREASRESTAPRWLLRVRDRLQDEYVSVPPLRQIALEVSVHPTYLAASFQKYFGVSVGEFVRLRRIEQAREMLSHTDHPLSEVALLLGFSDQSHFCRTFKKQTGLSPLEYRRLFATNPNPVQES